MNNYLLWEKLRRLFLRVVVRLLSRVVFSPVFSGQGKSVDPGLRFGGELLAF